MPTFIMAALVYVIQTSLNRGSMGANQALSVSLTRDSRRGLSGSLTQMARRVPSSVGPTFSGYLVEVGSINMPIFIGATLQLVYIWVYYQNFRDFDQKFLVSNQITSEKHSGKKLMIT
jgi:predicted MFS family arabinose efflux permease